MTEKIVNIDGLILSGEAIDYLKYIQKDTDYYHKGLIKLSDTLIAESLDKNNRLAELELLQLVSKVRVLMELLRDSL